MSVESVLAPKLHIGNLRVQGFGNYTMQGLQDIHDDKLMILDNQIQKGMEYESYRYWVIALYRVWPVS